jgi:hypothetical protein
VLLHGLLMDATLWEEVVGELSPATAASHRRCRSVHIAKPCATTPTSPCRGSQGSSASSSSASTARRHAHRQRHRRRLVQLLAADGAADIGRIALVSCEALDNFPPGLTGKTLVLTGKLAPSLFGLFMQRMRFRPLRRMPVAFGWLTKRGDATTARWIAPVLKEPVIRRDSVRVLRATRPHAPARGTIGRLRRARARRLGKPRPRHAARARTPPRRTPPQGRLVEIPDSYTLIPLDQPIALAKAIREFVR